MTIKYKFICYEDGEEIVTLVSNADGVLSEVLQDFMYFLKGTSFSFNMDDKLEVNTDNTSK